MVNILKIFGVLCKWFSVDRELFARFKFCNKSRSRDFYFWMI